MRYGILCGGTTFKRWEVQVIEHLESVGARPVLLVVNADFTRLSQLAKARDLPLDHLLFHAFRKVEGSPRSARAVDLGPRLTGVQRVVCRTTLKGKLSHYFEEPDLEAIRAHDLDFLLRFDFGILRGAILTAARYGVWSFHHDDEEKYRGAPPCFWEIEKRDDVTGVTLQRLTERLDGGIILRKGYFRTQPSYARNVDAAYDGSTRWPAQVCTDIRNGVASYLDAPPSKTTAPIYHVPTNGEVLRFVGPATRWRARAALERMFMQDLWGVGLVQQPIHSLLNGSLPSVHWLPAPGPNEFFADPFPLRADGKLFILCEHLELRERAAGISCLEIENGELRAVHRQAVVTGCHASYPYVVAHDGELYCVPETGQRREIVLYRARDVRSDWVRVASLVEEFPAVAATLFQYEGLWWMWAGSRGEGEAGTLYMWWAPALHGPWTPHAANPVKTDVRSARPAGTPFVHGGQLYRPAQDSSKSYGGRAAINRVTRINPKEYAEEVVAIVAPEPDGPYPNGLHTIAEAGALTVIDGKRRRLTNAHDWRRRLRRG